MRTRPSSFAVLSALCAAALIGACTPPATGKWTYGPTLATAAPESSGRASPAPASTSDPAPSSSPVVNDGYTLVGSKPCPESRFECITLAVPKDHLADAGGPTWDVTFAIQRATGERKGTFVVITGGPGSSGISSADSYADSYDPSIAETYDVVFIDQRGIGLSGPIQCFDAAAAYYVSPDSPLDPEERDTAAAAARTFVTDCLAEAGVAEADLPLYGTAAAIEDLEAIRDYLGAERLHLYGESYGTQYVQYYAAAHPDRIAALFVDGPVDLTIDGPTYYVEAARSADDTLIETLEACTSDATCAADVAGGDALAAYDALATRLSSGPLQFTWPMATGSTETRKLTRAELDNAAFGYIYSSGDRFVLQRAIAAASNENYVPLARLAYDSIGIEPETLEAEVDPTWSDALYYAVECQDYAFFPTAGDADARLDAWVAHAADAGIGDLRLGATYFGDLPCLYWPTARTSDSRPAPLLDTPYPVFVLTATTDPATPIANGMRIFSRLDDAYFFQAIGGPHIIFAWGEACPDDLISAFLVDGMRPPTRVTSCVWSVADPYVANAPDAPSDYDNALELASSVDDQILNTDDYLNRLEENALPIGCDFGGTLTYTPTDTGTSIALDACEFTDGLALSGSGASDDEAGTFELDLTIDGERLRYERDGEGGVSVTGRFEGRPVDLADPA